MFCEVNVQVLSFCCHCTGFGVLYNTAVYCSGIALEAEGNECDIGVIGFLLIFRLLLELKSIYTKLFHKDDEVGIG